MLQEIILAPSQSGDGVTGQRAKAKARNARSSVPSLGWQGLSRKRLLSWLLILCEFVDIKCTDVDTCKSVTFPTWRICAEFIARRNTTQTPSLSGYYQEQNVLPWDHFQFCALFFWKSVQPGFVSPCQNLWISVPPGAAFEDLIFCPWGVLYILSVAYLGGSVDWSMTSCHYPTPRPERDRMYQHKVSLVVRYFMIPCNICLILLATSTLGFAVLLFLNNCRSLIISVSVCVRQCGRFFYCITPCRLVAEWNLSFYVCVCGCGCVCVVCVMDLLSECCSKEELSWWMDGSIRIDGSRKVIPNA